MIRWRRGGEAEVVSLEKDLVTLLSTTPSPPGSRIEGLLDGDADGEAPFLVRIKVHACKVRPDGRFEITGRALELGAPARERITRGASGRR